jgi:hypothetical protein
VPHKRRYLGLAILALAVAAAAAMTTGAVRVPLASAATPDTCGYSGGTTPAANVPRASQKFNEIGIIEGFSVTNDANGFPLTVNTFYSDEHALTIGATGTAWVATYNDPNPASPVVKRIDDAGTNPAGLDGNPQPIPATLDTGPLATDPGGREVAPSLYLTDVTANASSTAGDWQNQSGPNTTAQRPNYVGGTWKNNGAANPLGSDGKEAQNGADLGPHSETFVNNISTSQGIEKFGAEVRWDTATLDTDSGTAGVQPPQRGHTYRVQMMFHDGDHNADTGEACTTFTVPPASPAAATQSTGGGTLHKNAADPNGPLVVETHDVANLSNGTANAGPTPASSTTSGRLTFRLYKQGTGSGGTAAEQEARCRATQITAATTVVVANNGANGTAGDFDTTHAGVYAFPDINLTDPGTYHWTVSYSGNTENNPAAETACNTAAELVTVSKAPSNVQTTPNLKITEDVHIKIDASAGASAGIKAGDKVEVSLFKQAVGATGATSPGCSADTVSGGTADIQGNKKTVTLTAAMIGANGEIDIGQLNYPADFAPGASGVTGTTTPPAVGNGDYWWFVSYLGNDQVTGSNDDCTEFFSISGL